MTDDLIERLESAREGSRELDVEILTKFCGFRDVYGDGTLFDRGNDCYWSLHGDGGLRLPSPTMNMHDAITLLPAGAEYMISTLHGEAFVELPLNGEPQSTRRHDGNVVLAFVTACLKERQS